MRRQRPLRGVTAGSCATGACEPGQGRKAAALSRSARVPQTAWPSLPEAGAAAHDRESPEATTPPALTGCDARTSPETSGRVALRAAAHQLPPLGWTGRTLRRPGAADRLAVTPGSGRRCPAPLPTTANPRRQPHLPLSPGAMLGPRLRPADGSLYVQPLTNSHRWAGQAERSVARVSQTAWPSLPEAGVGAPRRAHDRESPEATTPPALTGCDARTSPETSGRVALRAAAHQLPPLGWTGRALRRPVVALRAAAHQLPPLGWPSAPSPSCRSTCSRSPTPTGCNARTSPEAAAARACCTFRPAHARSRPRAPPAARTATTQLGPRAGGAHV